MSQCATVPGRYFFAFERRTGGETGATGATAGLWQWASGEHEIPKGNMDPSDHFPQHA